MQVLPVINVQSLEEAAEKIRIAAEFTDLVHLDIEDGVFLPRTSWGSPAELEQIAKRLSQSVKFEVHLMVANPEAVLDAWLRTGLVKRVIVHLEAMTDSVYILEKCKKHGSAGSPQVAVEAMLAINPGTEAERLVAHKDDFCSFQILAVQPGPSGQKFDPKILDKIKLIKAKMPNAIIEVDGGITLETAKMVKDAGAEIVVSDSYIFRAADPKKAYETLSKL